MIVYTTESYTIISNSYYGEPLFEDREKLHDYCLDYINKTNCINKSIQIKMNDYEWNYSAIINHI